MYIQQMDTDADGMVSYVEFKNFIETHLSPDIRPIRRLFDTIDTDGDGVVTHTELMLALRNADVCDMIRSYPALAPILKPKR